MLNDFAELIGLSTISVFQEAVTLFGLPGDDPQLLHEEWQQRGLLPLAVYRFVNFKLKQLPE